MFDWICGIFAGFAFNSAIHSAGLASSNGMHQMKEPECLQKAVEEAFKKSTKKQKFTA